MDGLEAVQGILLVYLTLASSLSLAHQSGVIYLFVMFQNVFFIAWAILTGLLLDQVTYTSDYFQDLYDLSVELIRRGHAYVDHQVAFQLNEMEQMFISLSKDSMHVVYCDLQY